MAMGRERCGCFMAGAPAMRPFPCQAAKLNGLDPEAYLANIIDRMAKGHPASRLAELLPWSCATTKSATALLRLTLTCKPQQMTIYYWSVGLFPQRYRRAEHSVLPHILGAAA